MMAHIVRLHMRSGVSRGNGGGGPPRVTSFRGWHPNEKKIIVAEFTKNTGQHDVERWELWRDDSYKGHHFVAMTKIGRQFLGGKWGRHRQLPPPGDTNPGDATASTNFKLLRCDRL